jgi:DNA repair protein RadC
MSNNIEDHRIGHRHRLKERFITSPSTVQDYEILEMVLFCSIPRKDVKELAKTLLKEFGDISTILNASYEQLLAIKGVTNSVYIHMRLLNELLSRSLKNKIVHKNILSSWNALIQYLQASQGSVHTEKFRVLFLNKKNILLADELQETGTIDQTPVYPREVVKRALFHEATAIILVHNHPSGNPKPSPEDIALTAHIVSACETIGVMVHDHVIICKNDFYSFKSNMLL